MTSPVIRFWKKKLVLWKPEVTYNTDPVPTAAANYIEARNVALTPADFDVEDRQLVKQSMGNTAKLITGHRLKLAFDVALAASGTLGTVPKIGTLLRGCGWAETITALTKVEYSLVSAAFESGAFYTYIDGVLHKGTGVRGTSSLKMDKGIPLLHVELTALYTAPTDTAPDAATRTGWPIEAPVNAANTLVCKLNSVDSWYSKFNFAQGNQVVHDDFPGGYQAISVKDRAPTAGISILAPTLAVFDPFALALAATNIPVQVVHGATAGNKVQVDLKTLITGVAYEEINGSAGYNLTLSPDDPTDADTEAKITFI
jgi:hypothetical protein